MTPAELWRAARPVTADPEASSWLDAWGMAPAKVAALGLARAFPHPFEAPTWARTWASRRARVLVPLRAPSGELRSLSALVLRPTPEAVRRVRLDRQAKAARLLEAGARASLARLVAGDDEGPDGPDVLAPKGLERAGSVAANGLAARWLAGHSTGGARCVVVRGELAWLRRASAEGRGVAVFGMVPGASWPRTVAKCIPDGSTLALELGDDATGDRLGAAFVGTLAPRLRAGAVVLATKAAA